jgi:mevalonate kinase
MEYYGKILLFGEHVVVHGAQALAMPFPSLAGQWRFEKDRSKRRAAQSLLTEWAAYLEHAMESGSLPCRLGIAQFRSDLAQGLFFESSIPPGYGAGSSGALCAALYDQYAPDAISREDTGRYTELKRLFGSIESFFHGASSGADPLVSYLNRPLLFDRDGALQAITLPDPSEAYTLFLLDTGTPRKTGPLVQVFKEWCADANYLARVLAELVPSTEDAIHFFLTGQWEALFEEWHILSGFQLRYMSQMILPGWEALWLEGLAGNQFKLKLCGAGGGGFVLGITKNWEQTMERFGDYRPMALRWQ